MLARTLLLVLVSHICVGNDANQEDVGYDMDDAMAEIGLLKTMLFHVDSRVKKMEKAIMNLDKGIKSVLLI